jgi:hypothetical protein
MKKKIDIRQVALPNGEISNLDSVAYSYILEQRERIAELEVKNRKLQDELDAIKPIIETGKLTPAVSAKCRDCKFVVKSRWNNQIIGCCKDSVCEDFKPEEQ